MKSVTIISNINIFEIQFSTISVYSDSFHIIFSSKSIICNQVVHASKIIVLSNDKSYMYRDSFFISKNNKLLISS